MQLEFPYQIVTFLKTEPQVNEPVYSGEHGWYPQVALKRRFKLEGITEEVFIDELKDFFRQTEALTIAAGDLVKPDHMPVQVIHIASQDEIKSLHSELLNRFGNVMVSRFADREGENYYPHVTAEYDGKFVIPVDKFTNKTFVVSNIWLLKDVGDENSVAYSKIH